MVLAPYGMLQSLLRERDLQATLAAVHRVLQKGGTFGVELVADLPSWQEYREARQPQGLAAPTGRRARHADRDGAPGPQAGADDLRSGVHRAARPEDARRATFSLAFRTLSVPQMVRRLEKAGFEITALLGDYSGREWDPRADVWVILAESADAPGPPAPVISSTVAFPLYSLEFSHVRPFQVAHHQA